MSAPVIVKLCAGCGRYRQMDAHEERCGGCVAAGARRARKGPRAREDDVKDFVRAVFRTGRS